MKVTLMNKKVTHVKSFPKVTVVTVVYNLIKTGREQYFRQCLESVHEQFYSNVEHIVVDGASVDDTLDLLEEYHKKEWITYYSEPDNGIYEAMNKGIRKATGKYIVFLNSDDYFCTKSAISLSIEALEREKTAFSCAYAYYLANEKPIARINVQPEVFFLCMPFSHQTMFTRRDILLKENCFNEKYKSAADYDLIVRLLIKGYEFSVVKDTISCFREGGFADSDFEKSKNEVRMIMKDNFSEDIGKISNGLSNYKYGVADNDYSNYVISLDTLQRIKKSVCFRIRKSIEKIRHKKQDNRTVIFSPKGYFLPLKWDVTLFGISIFSIERMSYPIKNDRIVFKLFDAIKLFEIKSSDISFLLRILYIPALKIKYR
ncbi:MAG: glycosyltransferase [Alphaproteobacteria bacterium]|nr:glycosyltransferase [Alphaproteobacteria bacterium]